MSSSKIKAKKSLGQHFLFNQEYLERIIKFSITDYNDIDTIDTIFEIGPGLGTLTDKISTAAGKASVVCIEKDAVLQPKLTHRWKNVSCILADALHIDWCEISKQSELSKKQQIQREAQRDMSNNHERNTTTPHGNNNSKKISQESVKFNSKHVKAGSTFDQYIARASAILSHNLQNDDEMKLKSLESGKNGNQPKIMPLQDLHHNSKMHDDNVDKDKSKNDLNTSATSAASISQQTTSANSITAADSVILQYNQSVSDTSKDSSLSVSNSAVETILIANLPYNISAPLIIDFITQRFAKRYCVLVQKEMAQRVCAKIGDEHYGRLAVLSQAYCNVRTCFDIHGDVFKPRTKVMSSFLIIEPKNLESIQLHEESNDTSGQSHASHQAYKTNYTNLDDTADNNTNESNDSMRNNQINNNASDVLLTDENATYISVQHDTCKSMKQQNVVEHCTESDENKQQNAKTATDTAIPLRIEDFAKLDLLVKTCFAQRRKMLSNLVPDEWKSAFSKCNVDLKQRAENIDVTTYIQIMQNLIANKVL